MPTTTPEASIGPHISPTQLGCGLRALAARWQGTEQAGDWASVALLSSCGVEYLRIIRRLESGVEAAAAFPEPDIYDEEGNEVDDEALPHHNPNSDSTLTITYDIIHSPSYRVPVLYLSCTTPANQPISSPATLYRTLVPPLMKSQIQAIGVMGAVSATEHPITGLPCYFVHPCKTADAMRPLCAGGEVDAEGYVLRWLGLVGGGVGLNVPAALAAGVAGMGKS
ncbi:hypothetical protein LTR28_004217 [Elasticomyces elasticus]|nr:hypothetical protein LTR28_004217 [Elasticomyces elasticus]